MPRVTIHRIADHRDLRALELGRALATDPRALLLDEVMAGLTPSETEQLMRTIRGVRHDRHISIIMVEHVMKAIMELSDRVIVLEAGRKIADHTPGAVACDPRVIGSVISVGMTDETELVVDHVDVAYGRVQVLRDISVKVGDKEIVTIAGANGAGKSTLLKTIAGLMKPSEGRITLDVRIDGTPAHSVAIRGLRLIAEGGRGSPT